MLSELQTNNKIVGIKQLRKALREGIVLKVFLADNADPKLIQPVIEACSEGSVPTETVPTMAELGRACGIEVGAAVAALVDA